jgi:hypothetical protein
VLLDIKPRNFSLLSPVAAARNYQSFGLIYPD